MVVYGYRVAVPPMEVLDFTSLTLDEFPAAGPALRGGVPPQMAAWRMEKPRTRARFTVYQNCPLRHRKIGSCLSGLPEA